MSDGAALDCQLASIDVINTPARGCASEHGRLGRAAIQQLPLESVHPRRDTATHSMTEPKLTRRHDTQQLADEFAAKGRIVLRDFLAPAFAHNLLADISELDSRNLWYQAACGDAAFLDETVDLSTKKGRQAHFAYRFEKYPVHNVRFEDIVAFGKFGSRRDIVLRGGESVEDAQRRIDRLVADPLSELTPTNRVHELRSLLRSDEFADTVSAVLGTRVSSGAGIFFLSRYRGADFLATHEDGADEGQRVCAAVLALTPFWLPHWGGNLILSGEDADAPAEVFTPRFNSLILFKVPRPHSVTSVAATCPRARYSLTGWVYRDHVPQ